MKGTRRKKTNNAPERLIEQIERIITTQGSEDIMLNWRMVRAFLESKISDLAGIEQIGDWYNPSEQLLTIFEIIQGLRGSLSLAEIYRWTVEAVRSKLGFEAAIMSVLSPDGKYFQRVAAAGIATDIWQKLKSQPVPREFIEGFMLEEFRVSRSYIVRHWSNTNEPEDIISYTPLKERKGQWDPDDMLLVPIYDEKGQLYGYITADSPVDGKMPSLQTIVTLEILASQAHQAIVTSLLHQPIDEQLKRTEFLFDTTTILSRKRDFNEALDNLVQRLQTEFQYRWVGLFFRSDETADALVVHKQAGLDSELFKGILFRSSPDGGVPGLVASTGHFFIVNDVEQGTVRLNPIFNGTMSELAVPIMRGDDVIGVLDIHSEHKNAFSQQDRRFARIIANQIAESHSTRMMQEKQELELRIRSTLADISRIINSYLELDELLPKTLDILCRTFHYWGAAIFLADEDEKNLRLAAFSGQKELHLQQEYLKIGAEGIVGLCASSRKVCDVPDVSVFPFYVEGVEGTKAELAMPILKGNHLIGVIDLLSPTIRGFRAQDREIIEFFANQLAVAIDNAYAHEKLQDLAIKDGLTKLYNHRYFMEILSKECVRSRRFKHPLALLMADIDHFKDFNDQFGHLVGDRVLKFVADMLIKSVRDQLDIVGRYGGEEFTIILPEADIDKAVEIAERIRHNIESHKPDRAKKKITISIGVAAYTKDMKKPSELIRTADEALYEAKRLGRNRVVTASVESDGTA